MATLFATTKTFHWFFSKLFYVNISLSEPVGSKAPTFSTELKSITIEKHFGQSFALLSNAQGFPVPLIRNVKPIKNFFFQFSSKTIFSSSEYNSNYKMEISKKIWIEWHFKRINSTYHSINIVYSVFYLQYMLKVYTLYMCNKRQSFEFCARLSKK